MPTERRLPNEVPIPRETRRGPIHQLDQGNYRAVIRNGVPMIERDDTAGCVYQVIVPVSRELVAELSADWSPLVRVRIEDGEFVFRSES